MKKTVMTDLEQKLTSLAEIAIQGYEEDSDVTNNAIDMACKLVNMDSQIKMYVEKVFFSEEAYMFPFYPELDFKSYMKPKSGKDILLHIFEDELFHEMLGSVDQGDTERFTYICMNVGEVMKESYCERLELMKEEMANVLKDFENNIG
ncbi:hypothetical protein [Bacillus manliponensis]|uniref:hypothetical protein n=1 Tax=Bacillus manliponensis TaxID=574376 RepID=UPI003515C7C3